VKIFPVASLKVVNLRRKFKINERALEILARDIAGRAGLKTRDLAIIFVSNRAIKKLNRRFRGEDEATDVLSFSAEIDLPRKGNISACDIFISLDKAKENARSFKNTFEKEITLYMIHGMLHLAGYDDRSASDEKKMRLKEKELLNHICKTTDLSKVLTRR